MVKGKGEAVSDTPEETNSGVHLELEDNYRFRVDFGEGHPGLLMDEPPPLGTGSGPNASAVLGAAVANCLSASLLYCLRRAHIDVDAMDADVEVTKVRNDRGRLRVGKVTVQLHPRVASEAEGRVRRCLELFEDFCVVTEAVRNGIEVDVSVSPGEGAVPPGSSEGRE